MWHWVLPLHSIFSIVHWFHDVALCIEFFLASVSSGVSVCFYRGSCVTQEFFSDFEKRFWFLSWVMLCSCFMFSLSIGRYVCFVDFFLPLSHVLFSLSLQTGLFLDVAAASSVLFPIFPKAYFLQVAHEEQLQECVRVTQQG